MKLGLSILALMLPFAALAAPVDIVNSGFEELYQGSDVLTGSFPVGPAPNGWTRYDLGGSPVSGSLLGVLNPGTQADYDADGAGLPPCFPAGAPEGDNVALLFKSGAAAADEYGIEQELGENLQPNTEYTLSVEVGNIQTCSGLPEGFRTTFNLDGFPGYRIELRAGGALLVADDNTLLPAEGTFEPSEISFMSPSTHPQLDQALSIHLISLNQSGTGQNLEVDFDDVLLEATQVAAVPILPATRWVLAALLVACGAACLRRWEFGPPG